jgi:small subunit ribosomal protein S24e
MATSIRILQTKKNALLNRQELGIEVRHSKAAMPDRKTLTQDLCEKMNVPKENIVVRNCKTRFGADVSTASVRVYDKLDYLEKYEPKHVLHKLFPKEKKGGERAMQRKSRKEEKNKKKRVRGTEAANKKKALKRQEKNK